MTLTKEDFLLCRRYTTTFVACVNWKIDYISLFKYLPIIKLDKDPLIDRKKTNLKLNLPAGCILQVKYKDVFKVVHSKGYGNKDGCFSNSVSILMYTDKLVSLKVPMNGRIQITGCRSETQIIKAVQYLWAHIQKIKKLHPEIVSIPIDEVPKIIYKSEMNNLNLNIGFHINKRKMHNFLYKSTDFVIVPNDSKYAGVTAKMEVDNIKDMPLIRHRFINNVWLESKVDWQEYLSMLNIKDRIKEDKKEHYNTFLIFHSGKVIFTGPRYDTMEDVFKYFITMINNNKELVIDRTLELT